MIQRFNHKLQKQIKAEANKSRIHSKLIQLTVESTNSRINLWLNLSIVDSTNSRIYRQLNLPPVAKVKEGQSQRSKIVKPSGAVGFGPPAIAPPASARPGPIYGAGKLGRELRAGPGELGASCELGAGRELASLQAVLNKSYVQKN